MDIIFYKVTDPKNTITKTLGNSENSLTVQGTLRDGCDTFNPVVMFTTDVSGYNYCYISQLNRYYFVDDVRVYRNSAWILSMSEDVLMSFSSDILLQSGYVDRYDGASKYVTKSLRTDVRDRVKKIDWNYEFQEGSYVLITAGGQ